MHILYSSSVIGYGDVRTHGVRIRRNLRWNETCGGPHTCSATSWSKTSSTAPIQKFEMPFQSFRSNW